MSKEDDARKELDDILKGLLTDKNMKRSDRRIFAYDQRSNDPLFLKRLSESNKKRDYTDDLRYRIGSGRRGKPPYNKGKKRSASTLEIMSKVQSKPVLTPNGPFISQKEAYIYYAVIWKLKPAGAQTKMSKLLDTENSGFKKITREEYIMLTGKDPWNEK